MFYLLLLQNQNKAQWEEKPEKQNFYTILIEMRREEITQTSKASEKQLTEETDQSCFSED